MVDQPTTLQPIEYAKETILGMTIALEQRFGCQPRNDVQTTLNKLFGVFPTRLPVTPRVVKHFCWGVGGRLNNTSNLSSAQYVSGTNMGLYAIRPFRVIPLEDDLSETERKPYAMRVVKDIDGVPFAHYYLKEIDFTQSQVQYIRTDPISGTSTDYLLDYNNLKPVPPLADDNGVITDVADAVSVVLPGTLTITGQEVLESVGVIDGGDMRYAVASEIGFVSSSLESVNATDFNNAPFPYNEAIMAQVVDHYTWTGNPLMSVTDVYTKTLAFSLKNQIIAG